MAAAYNWSRRFCPPVQTASVRFPKKIQYPAGCPVPYPWSLGKGVKNCPAPDGCSLGAITNVQIDEYAVVLFDSTYVFQGTDRYQFEVSNVITGLSYTFSTMNTYYPVMGMAGDANALYTVAVSPVVNENICTTCNVVFTNIIPSAPFGVNTTSSNISWTAPAIPENYGVSTVQFYTVSHTVAGSNSVVFFSVTDPLMSLSGTRWSLNLASDPGTPSSIFATNMAGSSMFSRPG